MNAFTYRNKQLHAESVPLSDIASQYGTPCFVYSRAHLEERFRGVHSSFDLLARVSRADHRVTSGTIVLLVGTARSAPPPP